MYPVTPDDIVYEAEKWIGTPFVHQGHRCGIASDCLGLIYGIAFNLGLTDISLPNYGVEPTGNTLKTGLDREMDRVTDYSRGDVLTFRIARLWQHVGVYTGRDIIHAYQPNGRVVRHILDDKWRQRHVASYRYKGLDYG